MSLVLKLVLLPLPVALDGSHVTRRCVYAWFRIGHRGFRGKYVTAVPLRRQLCKVFALSVAVLSIIAIFIHWKCLWYINFSKDSVTEHLFTAFNSLYYTIYFYGFDLRLRSPSRWYGLSKGYGRKGETEINDDRKPWGEHTRSRESTESRRNAGGKRFRKNLLFPFSVSQVIFIEIYLSI